MGTTKINAVEMTRQIRDQIYELTKGLSGKELIAYYRSGSRKFQNRTKSKQRITAISAQPRSQLKTTETRLPKSP